MPVRGKRHTTPRGEQLELLGPRPRVPQWRALPEGVRGEVTKLLARLWRQGDGAIAKAGGDAEVGDE